MKLALRAPLAQRFIGELLVATMNMKGGLAKSDGWNHPTTSNWSKHIHFDHVLIILYVYMEWEEVLKVMCKCLVLCMTKSSSKLLLKSFLLTCGALSTCGPRQPGDPLTWHHPHHPRLGVWRVGLGRIFWSFDQMDGSYSICDWDSFLPW